MSFRRILILPLAAAALLRAQEPFYRPVPFGGPEPASSPGEDALSRIAAERAQTLGFPAIAAGLDRQLLASAPESARPGLTLDLATALLDDNRAAEAEQALRSLAAPRGSGWHLRMGLAEAAERRFDEARRELASVRSDDLPAADRGWYDYLEGVAANAGGDPTRASEWFRQARSAPGLTDLMRARFFLADEEARLRLGPVSSEEAEQIRQNADRFQGTPFGYDSIRSYAVMLYGLGRRTEAVTELQRGLLSLPPAARAYADDFRLLIGMIAGAGEGVGRDALMTLLDNGSDPERQRVALQLLADASEREPERRSFRAELDRLIGGSSPHPVLEDLLLFRATWALGDRDYAQAEADAHDLLERFPGSPLKAQALGVLTDSAWEQRRYRTAADYADQARAALAPGESRAELAVLVAEARFRDGMISGTQSDFSGAADAYAAALQERPPGVPAGDLMFQRVEAMIEAGSAAAAEPVLDELERDPVFDPVNRWRAEWNLARALQLEGRTAAAYARVSRLLGSGAPAPLPAELRAQMAWLQARLSLDAGLPAETLRLVDRLGDSLAGVGAGLNTDIASSGALLRAEALFALGREQPALAALGALRKQYASSAAAVQSYIVEAQHDAAADRIVDAQVLFIKLADTFRQNQTYAPYALYQAALLGERLGQENDLTDADRLIERLVTDYPSSDLVFYARLKQGDLLRRLNEFAQAEQTYRDLMDHYSFSQWPDVVYAQLALAESEDAQAATDPTHAERALNLFEDLCDRAGAPVEVRVEAGYNLGALYARRGDPGQAETVWWRNVVTPFLLDPAQAARLDAKGRYWMARTLVELGDLFRTQGRYEQAADAWRRVGEAGLPYAQVARERLSSLAPAQAKP